MDGSGDVYTYQGGQKVWLNKRADQFVVRALPATVEEVGLAAAEDAEQVSSSSTRVTIPADDLERAMSEARAVAPTHHAYEIADGSDEFLLTDRVLVTFNLPLSARQVAAFAERYGLVQKAAYSDRDYLFQLTERTGMNPIKLVVKLTEDEQQVQTAEHDLNHRVSTYDALPSPTDPVYARQWHLHDRLVDPRFDVRASSRCEAAWQRLGNHGSADVVVGVTDDGCKLDHLDFDSAGKFAGWGYFEGLRLFVNTDADAEPTRMYQVGANHGTSCAGVVAAELDSTQTVGAAPGCRLLPIKWESDGPSLFISDSKILTALNFVADKVDVLSNSWGRVPLALRAIQVTNRVAELAQTGGRRGRGIVFLWAAGNENCPIQHNAAEPVPFTNGWNLSVDPPVWIGVQTSQVFKNSLVGIPGVMHVAALGSSAQRSHYSNYGTGIGICAPSSNSHRFRRLQIDALGISTTTGAGTGVTDRFGGTSSATPLVAGIAALVISANPTLSALHVISILKRTASKDLSMTGYAKTPAANFDPDTAWDVSPIDPFTMGAFQDLGLPEGSWSPWFGHGRVNAEAAVVEAQALLPTPVAVAATPARPRRPRRRASA